MRPPKPDGWIPKSSASTWNGPVAFPVETTYRTELPVSVNPGSLAASPVTAISLFAVALSKPCGNSRLSFKYPTAWSKPVVTFP